MYVFADSDITCLARSLALGGPATVASLVERLQADGRAVCSTLERAIQLGVVRPSAVIADAFELDRDALRASVDRARRDLLGEAA